MTLVANSVRGGSALSGYNCFTIDEGRTDMEYVCGTISGTTVSNLTRGIDPLTGTTTNSTLRFAHRVGANVKVTDYPLIQILRNLLNAVEHFPNLLQYATTTTPCHVGSSNFTICEKSYIDATANAGASDANETTKGIAELATAAEAGAGTQTGSSAARLVLPASIATSTCNSAAFSVLVASSTTGKVNPPCIDQAFPYVWTKIQTFSATTSIAGTAAFPLILNTLEYSAPSVRAASSTVLSENGSGRLSWVDPMNKVLLQNTNIGGSTTASATSTYYTYTIPAGTLVGTHKSMRVTAMFTGAGSSGVCRFDVQLGTGSASSSLIYATQDSVNSVGKFETTIYAPTSATQKIVSTFHGGNDTAFASSVTTGFVNGTHNLANQAYLSFRGSASASGVCSFQGATIEVLTQ